MGISRLVVFLFFFTGAAFPYAQDQNPYKDVLLLKNGYAFKCTILKVDPNGVWLLDIQNDSVFFKHELVQRIRQHKNVTFKEVKYKINAEQRWVGSLNVGLGSGGPNESVFTVFSLDVGLKYRLLKNTHRHFLRSNIGLQNYKGFFNINTLGFKGGYQFLITSKRIAPYLFGDVGYGFVLTNDERMNNFETYSHKGGANYAFGLGLVIPIENYKAIDVSMGYISQKAKVDIFNEWSRSIIDQQINRVMLKIGLNF